MVGWEAMMVFAGSDAKDERSVRPHKWLLEYDVTRGECGAGALAPNRLVKVECSRGMRWGRRAELLRNSMIYRNEDDLDEVTYRNPYAIPFVIIE
jgi:hypothetical protein